MEGASLGTMLQSLAALAIVLIAIAAAAFAARRMQSGGLGGNAWLKTVAAMPVGPRERVVIVEIEETWLVLGVAQGAVRTLHTMPKSGQAPPAAGPRASFGEWLAKARSAGKPAEGARDA